MINTISIGKIIKKLRVENKLTQEELAEKIDISTNYLSKIERGLCRLNVEAFLNMAEVLGFSLEDFGISASPNISETKKNLIQTILGASDKEVTAYWELYNAIISIKKVLK